MQYHLKYRSTTIKARSPHNSSIDKLRVGRNIVSKAPIEIGQIPQSLERPEVNIEPEDFGLNDTDEQVTAQKKMIIQGKAVSKNSLI